MTHQQGPGKTQYKPQFSVKWDRSFRKSRTD